jgi:hypothetical protein
MSPGRPAVIDRDHFSSRYDGRQIKKIADDA